MRGGLSTGKRATTGDVADWRAWWNWNSEPYLRNGLVASFETTPGPADPSNVDLTPRLAALLGVDDPRTVANGLIALARATPVSQSERVAPLVRKHLDDPQLPVREAAMVALGILRDHESIAPLAALLSGGANVPCSQRQIAALALGLIGGSDAETRLLARLHSSICPDLACAALLGAAQAAPDSTRVASHALAIVRSDACDVNARACAALALSRLKGDAGRAALSQLVAIAREPGTPSELRASALLALGSLATTADGDAMAELQRAAQTGGALRPRSLAIVAIGRVIERDADRANDGAARASLLELLRSSALHPERRADRPWAMLALGFALHNEPEYTPQFRAAAAPLREFVASSAPPEERAAAAIALGLMGDREASGVLVTQLGNGQVPTLATALVQGLGMLRVKVTAPAVRAVAFDASVRCDVRVEAARALASLGDATALPRMAKELGATHDVSEAAVLCASLAKMRTTAAIDPLALQAFGTQHGGQDATRRCAAAALGELTEGGTSGSLPFWCAYSIDRDVELRAPVLRPVMPQ